MAVQVAERSWRWFIATGHRVFNSLLLVGIVVQFWAAGWAVFGQPFTIHAVLGWVLMPVALLSLLAAALAYGLSRRTMWAAVLLLVLALQPVFVFVLSAVSIALAALHPVNGLAAFCIALFLQRRGTGAGDGNVTAA